MLVQPLGEFVTRYVFVFILNLIGSIFSIYIIFSSCLSMIYDNLFYTSKLNIILSQKKLNVKRMEMRLNGLAEMLSKNS